MATASELTLHVIDFLQSPAVGEMQASPARWMFVPPPTQWPGGPGYTFAEAAAHLEGIPKPVFIGALNHPGVVAVWPRSGLTPADDVYLQRLIGNQLSALGSMRPSLGSHEATTILFDKGTDRITISLDAFRLWLSEYGMTWGWRLGGATGTDHDARLLVLKDGRYWSPGEACHPVEAT